MEKLTKNAQYINIAVYIVKSTARFSEYNIFDVHTKRHFDLTDCLFSTLFSNLSHCNLFKMYFLCESHHIIHFISQPLSTSSRRFSLIRYIRMI